jgi:hypothetical protein
MKNIPKVENKIETKDRILKPLFIGKKPNKKKKYIFLGLLYITILICCMYFISQFFDTYRLIWQSPIILQTPIKVEQRSTSIVSPVPEPLHEATKASSMVVQTVEASEPVSDYDIVMGKKNGDILWKVYKLESSLGKNDGCKKSGKWNGFGYGQNTNVWNCFDTFEEVAYKVDAWFTDKFNKGYTVEESLCLYNVGTRTNDCDYAKQYWNL